MNKFKKAAMLFGKDGSAGESDAIANYLQFIGTMHDTGFDAANDAEAIANVKERIGDELNHLLGDTLDGINIAGLKITPDGMDKILDGLRAAVATDETQEIVNIDPKSGYPINL